MSRHALAAAVAALLDHCTRAMAGTSGPRGVALGGCHQCRLRLATRAVAGEPTYLCDGCASIDRRPHRALPTARYLRRVERLMAVGVTS